MIYLWDEQQRAINLARYRLDFRDAHTALHAAHAWKFRNRDAQMAVARVCNGVAVFVRAALSPDGEAVTILEFRPAYRWEAVIADNLFMDAMTAAHTPMDLDAYNRNTPHPDTPFSDWGHFNAWAWFPWDALEKQTEFSDEANRDAHSIAISEKMARNRAKLRAKLARAKAAKAAARRKCGRPAKTAGNRYVQFSIRVPCSVLKRWQHAGKGWQTRMAQRLATLECEHQPTSALDLAFLPPTRRKRGQVEPSDSKTPICLRLPPDVLARWKATGPSWQTRVVAWLAAP